MSHISLFTSNILLFIVHNEAQHTCSQWGLSLITSAYSSWNLIFFEAHRSIRSLVCCIIFPTSKFESIKFPGIEKLNYKKTTYHTLWHIIIVNSTNSLSITVIFPPFNDDIFYEINF